LSVYVSRIRFTQKVMNGFEIFSSCGGVPQEEVIKFWDHCPNYPQESQQCKKNGAWMRFALFDCFYNVLPLAAMFHSDNLVEMQYK